MQITFNIEKKQFLDAYNLMYTHNSSRIIFYGFLAVYFTLDFIIFGFYNSFLSWIFLTLFVGLIDMVVFSKISRIRAGKRYKKFSEFFQEPFSIEIDTEGLNYQSENNSNFIKWKNIAKSYSNKNLIVIKTPDQAIKIIPKYHLSSEHISILKKGLKNYSL